VLSFLACPADDEAHDQYQHGHEDDRADDARHDHLRRLQPRDVRLVLRPLADPEKRPEHRLRHLERRGVPWLLLGHRRAPQPGPPLPFTSKNVYDSVIVFMSSGSPGSTTNTTGIRRTSPGPSVCSRKQKHSIFLK